ncbi:MAG: TolC family protein [Chloroflexi bacterium]|nr:TolC family protein [Chloroflexota bacterium]
MNIYSRSTLTGACTAMMLAFLLEGSVLRAENTNALTLNDCLRESLSANHALLARSAESDAFGARAKGSTAARLPRLFLQGGAQHTSDPYRLQPATENNQPGLFTRNTWQAAAGVTLPLYAGGKLAAEQSAARLLAEAASGDVAFARQALAVRWWRFTRTRSPCARSSVRSINPAPLSSPKLSALTPSSDNKKPPRWTGCASPCGSRAWNRTPSKRATGWKSSKPRSRCSWDANRPPRGNSPTICLCRPTRRRIPLPVSPLAPTNRPPKPAPLPPRNRCAPPAPAGSPPWTALPPMARALTSTAGSGMTRVSPASC